MASILDRYGIKEVADVTFYELNANGQPTNPVLYLDTLKVSTIEQTAENASANGGKGNAPLIIWDYGKEITVTLEDALFSAKSMAIMFGNGKVKGYSGASAYIMKTEEFIATDTVIPTAGTDGSGWKAKYEGPDGKLYAKVNPKFYAADGSVVTTNLVVNEKFFCTFDILVNGSVIEISANSFPGTYYVTGDTFARSEASGKDEFFQFIIPKAKVTSENTITLEAEGDPSVFNMNLRVMRPADGVMMKLVKYDALNGTDVSAGDSAEIIHNHSLQPTTPIAPLNMVISAGSSATTTKINSSYTLGDGEQFVYKYGATVPAAPNGQVADLSWTVYETLNTDITVDEPSTNTKITLAVVDADYKFVNANNGTIVLGE